MQSSQTNIGKSELVVVIVVMVVMVVLNRLFSWVAYEGHDGAGDSAEFERSNCMVMTMVITMRTMMK